MFQIKEKDKSPEIDLTETDISNISDTEFKTMGVRMLTKVRRAMHEQSENFNKDIGTVQHCWWECEDDGVLFKI